MSKSASEVGRTRTGKAPKRRLARDAHVPQSSAGLAVQRAARARVDSDVVSGGETSGFNVADGFVVETRLCALFVDLSSFEQMHRCRIASFHLSV